MDREQHWVALALHGDRQAFGCLVHAYQRPVYNLCYRMLGNAGEGEDAAQETFERVYTHLAAYDPGQKLSTWILSIASHGCIDRLRKRRISWLSLDEIGEAPQVTSDTPHAEHVLIKESDRREVTRLLRALPADYRLAIVLRYWQDLSYEEIARVTGTTEAAVKSRLHRARQAMARQLLDRESVEAGSVGLGRAPNKVGNHALL
jgi:RNA polymerase sigma-70 factor (ECF subfamily)